MRTSLLLPVALACCATVLAIASACGGHAPTPYSQGAPVAPRPPAFNPTTDAPITVGQPGHIAPRPRVEPGPKHGRVLPQTPETRREPGLWAPKPPTASLPVEPPQILGVTPPVPGQLRMPDDGHARSICAHPMEVALKRVDHSNSLTRLAEDKRRCLAMHAYTTCLTRLLMAIEHAQDIGGGFQAGLIPHIKATVNVGTQALRTACAGVTLDDSHTDLINKALAEWERMADSTP